MIRMKRSTDGSIKEIKQNDSEELTSSAITPENLLGAPAKPYGVGVLLDVPPVDEEVQIAHAWNRNDRSPNIILHNKDLTFRRIGYGASSDAVRGKIGFSTGLHIWEIYWPKKGTDRSAVVGVATLEASLTSVIYSNLVGSTDQSWGWNLFRKELYHCSADNTKGVPYPTFLKNHKTLILPDKLLVILDMDSGTLSFGVNQTYLGIAFSGLKGKTLYPIASTYWAQNDVTIRYLGSLDNFDKPLTLLGSCRRIIRKKIDKDNFEEKIMQLDIPLSLKFYLLYKNTQ